MDRHLVETIAEYLQFLKREWDQQVDDASLKRSSNVLRVLTDGSFGRAWRELGFPREPTVRTLDFDKHLGSVDRSTIVFAQAGGATYQGVAVQGALVQNVAIDAAEVARRYKRGIPQWSPGLSTFLKANCMVVGGTSIARHDVVKYVANKLGGAHIDTSRDPARDQVDLALDSVQGKHLIAGKPAVYFELLSIGQAIASADDTAAYLRKVGASNPAH